MRDNPQVKSEKKRKLLILLSAGIVLCLAVTIWALFFRTPAGSPDYAPDKLEPNAQVIENDDSAKLDAPSGGAISLQYEEQVTIDLSDKKAYFNYSNPGKSTQNIVLEIVIREQTVAKSALIKPGYKITELPLLDGADALLSQGVYNEDAVFKILSYNPETGEKAIYGKQIRQNRNEKQQDHPHFRSGACRACGGDDCRSLFAGKQHGGVYPAAL